jgi:hypothetical protein
MYFNLYLTRRTCSRGLAAALSAAIVLVAMAGSARASISVTTNGFNYTQDFDTLPATGSATFTDDSTIAAWFTERRGTGTTIVANTGSSNAGNLYSYGTGTATERALGSVGSGNPAVGDLSWGVLFQNNTGSALESVDLRYIGEQWRNSGDAAAQTLAFYYMVDNGASPPGSPEFDLADDQSGWTTFAALNFTSPVFDGSAGALDGNLAANRSSLSSLVTFNTVVDPGKWVWLAWLDIDHAGADHGLAIDNVSATFNTQAVAAAVPETATALVWLVLCGMALAGRKWTRRLI